MTLISIMKSTILRFFVIGMSALVLNASIGGPANAQTKAALTRDIDRPGAQPVHGKCQSRYGSACTLYTVPSGKRLVVQTVSYYILTTDGGQVEIISFGKNAADLRYGTADNSYVVTPAAVAISAFGPKFLTWSGSQTLLSYFEEGEDFAAASFSRTGSTTERYSFSGYLVDK